MRDARAGALALLLCVAPLRPAAPAPPAPRKTDLAPPFDVEAPTPHRIAMSIDEAPARDLLALLTGAPDAPGTLRRLKGYRSVDLALSLEGLSPDDFFGRLVGSVAGTPDPLLETWARGSQRSRMLLDMLKADGSPIAALGARRVASLLPQAKPIAVRLVLVPFFSTAGFAEVAAAPDGDAIYLIADVPRLGGDPSSPASEREVMLSMLRAVFAKAWKTVFETSFQKPPLWPDERTPDFETLLSRTVSEGPATLFLFPDEFFPIGSLLEEPIGRAFLRWNRLAEILTDPKKKESERRDALAEPSGADFWRRSASIVGAAMTEVILRRDGREAFLQALASGPRAVVSLYEKEAQKDKRLPQLGAAAKKALDHGPISTPAPSIPRAAPGAEPTKAPSSQ
ncbi:MAG TPA: hypothetical protein VKF32_10575 [Thermoanaerobaculia bacterium]|nr:hypothetical protein [Thermoanaerobaculia bacterium]